MFLLYGKSPSGKTEYFLSKFPGQEVRILHASSLEELRNCIASVENLLLDPLPTLVNVWYDLDCKKISDLKDYDVYLEAHYLEGPNGIQEIKSGNMKYFYGLRNEHLIEKRKMFLRRIVKEKKFDVDWISMLGTRYRYFESNFPSLVK